MRAGAENRSEVKLRANRRALTLIGLLFLAVSCAAPSVETPVPETTVTAVRSLAPVFPVESWERIGDPEAAGYDGEKLMELGEYVSTLNTTGLMVVVGGRVLFEYGDLEVLSYLASVRKSILAMMYGVYVADGTIDLSRTLTDLEMTDHGGLLPIEQGATVENLITARSGIYHAASNAGDNSADAPPRGSQRPGEYFLYNNWDFNAAGAAFEKMTGVDIYDALQDILAIPIGMQDFQRDRQRKSGNLEQSMYPAYHIWLSTRDMARIGYLMLREGNWAGNQIIPRDWARRIVSVYTHYDEMNPDSYRGGEFGYGYMWWVWDGPQAVGALEGAYTGRGAYGQYITVLPVLDMVIAHKTSSRRGQTGWSDYRGIIERLIAARIEMN